MLLQHNLPGCRGPLFCHDGGAGLQIRKVANMRYMPALDYNKWYLDKVIKQGIDDISSSRESEMAEPSQRLTQEMSSKAGAGVQIKATVAQTELRLYRSTRLRKRRRSSQAGGDASFGR
jgi:hypothetical protein